VNVALVQMDGKLPNLALMQIASHHLSLSDNVQWWHGPLFSYDKVYASKIFDFTDDDLPDYVIRGGTGYDLSPLPEYMQAGHSDGWFLYPKYDRHLGFSERGCRLTCKFCVVPEKEGRPRKVAEIGELLTNPRGEDRLVLLDDDFLGHPDSEETFLELIDRKLNVNFICGLNVRTITERQAELLASVRFKNNSFKSRQITFAWDNPKDKPLIERGFKRCVDAGIKPYQMQFFVLIGFHSTPEEDLDRVETIRAWGADPFVMAYDRSFKYQRDFQRWVNHRAIFKTVRWEEYKA
jgi:hypothetical protein|tara:strand:- start:2 stop:880 length:879 start_codon:yes stop_codon:yes gene_type:complete